MVCFPALFPRPFSSNVSSQSWPDWCFFSKLQLTPIIRCHNAKMSKGNFLIGIYTFLANLFIRVISLDEWLLVINHRIFFLDLPDEGPIITGGFPRYHIGDKVQINCTSHKSKPAAKLRWYINGEQADKQNVKRYRVSFLPRMKLKTLISLHCTIPINNHWISFRLKRMSMVWKQALLVFDLKSKRNTLEVLVT